MVQDISKSIEACAAHYGSDADAMREYLINGQNKALEMDNRGPIVFEADGALAPHIVEAYDTYGFYVFTNVLGQDEIEDIKQDLGQVKNAFPSVRAHPMRPTARQRWGLIVRR
jgi:hypothetical protein